MTPVPSPGFDHVLRMSDERGTFEHAEFDAPRVEHGYCTDDMARVVVVTAREPDPHPDVSRLLDSGIAFLSAAQGEDGAYRNRMNRHGQFTDRPTVEDCWGRAIWALGTAVARAPGDDVRRTAANAFERSARRRSPWLRAMAFAAVGAAEVFAVDPDHRGARALLGDAAHRITSTETTTAWPWPEPRLTYANAVIPEALIAAGSVLDRPALVERGLDLLRWLVDHETLDGHLSPTPAGGGGPDSPRPGFDQQPIEVAALADACVRAAMVDSDERWPRTVASAVAWFLGDNDGGHVMWDAATGGGFDGLQASGPNLNQGTESTLAFLSTLQHARLPAPIAS